MPKRATMDDDSKIHEDLTAKSNGINEAQLKGFVAEIEDELEKIEENNRLNAIANQPHLDRIKEIKTEAAEAGIPKKPLSAKLRERGLRRRADKCRETLSEEQISIFDEISQKLGDLFSFADRQDEREAA